MGRLIVKVTGVNKVRANFDRLSFAASDLRPVLHEIDVSLMGQMERNFESEGPGWQSLSPSTVRRRGSAHPILVDKGRLRRSYVSPNSDHVARIDRDSLSFGSAVQYAGFHQTGTRKMPRRAQAIPPGTRTEVIKIVQRYLVEAGGLD